jgi:hypothetical protein
MQEIVGGHWDDQVQSTACRLSFNPWQLSLQPAPRNQGGLREDSTLSKARHRKQQPQYMHPLSISVSVGHRRRPRRCRASSRRARRRLKTTRWTRSHSRGSSNLKQETLMQEKQARPAPRVSVVRPRTRSIIRVQRLVILSSLEISDSDSIFEEDSEHRQDPGLPELLCPDSIWSIQISSRNQKDHWKGTLSYTSYPKKNQQLFV